MFIFVGTVNKNMEEIEVPTEHLHEKIQEAAEEEKKEKWVLFVALSTAIIAVLAAVASLMGGHHENEALLEQLKASDQWAYYQAKGIKSEISSSTAKILAASGAKVNSDDLKQKIDKYEKEKAEIKIQATEFETSSTEHLARHLNFAKSVTIFQISIAVAAIAILTRRKILWYLSMIAAAGGTVFLILGFI